MRWMSRWGPSFFGLHPERGDDVTEYSRNLWTELHQLVTNCKISLTEAWKLPIEIRRFWMELSEKESKKGDAPPGAGKNVTRR